MIRAMVLSVAVAAGGAASAQPIVIEAEDGFVLVRCLDRFGSATCEFLSASTASFLNCVAFDAEGQPLGVTVAMPSMGQANFSQLEAARIDRVMCRP